jgi:hypothetical protein
MRRFRSRHGVPSIAMSIHRVMRKSVERYLVRYRDADGVNRSRAVATRQEAERFQRGVEAAKARRRARELQADLERF